MTKRLSIFVVQIFATGLMLVSPGTAADASSTRLTIGYLELENDSRYAERSAYARIQLQAQRRPYPGAEVALEEARMTGEVIGVDFKLQRRSAGDLNELTAIIGNWAAQDEINFILLDLPAELVASVASATGDHEVLLFNLSAAENHLRGADCHPRLMHTLPSHGMQSDALLQYLISMNWQDLLVLHGPRPEDAALVNAISHSAKRFGAEIVATRSFQDSNDPRSREQHNISLLTGGSYDVVVVADTEGEFGRYVPYQTRAPRPVVGTTGLEAAAWSRVWERHGAPQVNDRFQDHAGRAMHDADWSAWAAVKAVVQSALRNPAAGFAQRVSFIQGDELRLDGAKGPAMSFRPWNNQLRQPLLLATHDAVVARAPMDGFLHPHNTLDTLGTDRAESDCHSVSSPATGGLFP